MYISILMYIYIYIFIPKLAELGVTKSALPRRALDNDQWRPGGIGRKPCPATGGSPEARSRRRDCSFRTHVTRRRRSGDQ